MKLRSAKTYRKLTQKVTPRYGKIINHVANTIARAAEQGFTKTNIDVSNILYEVGLDIDESRFMSVVNLVIKELSEKDFMYKLHDDKTISIYW